MYPKDIRNLIWIVLCLTFANNLTWGQSLSYTVSVSDPYSKLFNVKCEIQNPDQDKLQLDWPAWTPGYVVLWNFGKYISNLSATDQNDSLLTVRRVSESRAFVECNNAQLIILNYQVQAIDPPENLGFAQAYLDSIQGWYNGSALFPEIKGLRDVPITIRFDLPKGWKLATGMKPSVEKNCFIVQSFDELVDSPVQIGHFLSSEFLSNGVQFKAVVAGCDSVDMNDLEAMLKKIVNEEFALMKNVPIDRYLFIFHAASRGAGGLEHLNATTISLRTEEYFKKDSWLKVVTAHEFFHVWNAKRIRTRTFDRYDYSRPHRTQTVWFAEGITAYYTDIILHRCGLFTKEDVYASLAKILDLYENNPARKRLSWEDISWYIWEPEIRQGLEVWLLPGWMIDLKIRDATDNAFSLDDIMRFMNLWNGESKIGFEEDDLPRIISSVTLKDFSDFFRRHISGCEPFPYNELFAAAGLEWNISTEIVPSLGYRFGKMVDKRVKVIDLDEDQDVQDNGLQINDIILEINGCTRPTFDEIQRIQRELKPGSEVAVLIDREGVKLSKTIRVTRRELIRSKIQEIPNPTPRQLSIRNGILDSITQQ